MAIDLTALEPQKISRDLKGKFSLIYGDPKCGKSTLASEFDKVLMCGFEWGTNALNNVYVQPMKTWKDWKDTVKQLCDPRKGLSEKFSSICIDTVDEAFKLAEKYLCADYGVEEIKEIGAYGSGYKLLDKEFMSGFRELAFAGYGIIFISHSTEKALINDKGEEYTKIVPALPNRPFNLINKFVDTIAYIREIHIQNEEGKPISKRYMFFRGNEKFLAGSRFKYIEPKCELSYKNFVDTIYNAIDKEVKIDGGSTTEETNPYTERSYEELMDEAKELWSQVIANDLMDKVQEIISKAFDGKISKLSEIKPEQKAELSYVLMDIRDLL